jgi:hypothetical protein
VSEITPIEALEKIANAKPPKEKTLMRYIVFAGLLQSYARLALATPTPPAEQRGDEEGLG